MQCEPVLSLHHRYLCLMSISHDYRPAQRVELSFLSVTADSPVMDAIKSHLRILCPKNAYRSWSVEKQSCTSHTPDTASLTTRFKLWDAQKKYVKCERLLFMNKLLNPAICATHCACTVIALSSALIKWSYQQPSDSYTWKIVECFLDSNFCCAPTVIFGNFSIW